MIGRHYYRTKETSCRNDCFQFSLAWQSCPARALKYLLRADRVGLLVAAVALANVAVALANVVAVLANVVVAQANVAAAVEANVVGAAVQVAAGSNR